jgi:hypothetical protein
VQQEIHVEAADEGFIRLAPFAHHGGVWEFPVEELAYILPQCDGALSVLVVLH